MVRQCQNHAKIVAVRCDFGGLRGIHCSSSMVEILGGWSSAAALHRHQAPVLLWQCGGGKNSEGRMAPGQLEKRKKRRERESRTCEVEREKGGWLARIDHAGEEIGQIQINEGPRGNPRLVTVDYSYPQIFINNPNFKLFCH